MTWTASSFPYGSVLTSTQMTQLFDNITSAMHGETNAPRLYPEALADSVAGTAYTGDSGILSSAATSYTEIANYRVIQGGSIRCQFKLTSNSAGGNGHARIYKNGVAYGTARLRADNNYQTFTEDLSFAANDTLQIYAYCTGTPSATLVYVKDILFGSAKWISPPVPLTLGER